MALSTWFRTLFSSKAAPGGDSPGHTCSDCGRVWSTKEYIEHAGIRTEGTKARCRYCHTWVALEKICAHEKKHTVAMADGQNKDHVTLPPDERYQGSLSSVPRSYRHVVCGAITGMPEEITRTYLANPFMYGEYTFCTGCGDYIHGEELKWVETGETFFAYRQKLKEEWIAANGEPPCPWNRR